MGLSGLFCWPGARPGPRTWEWPGDAWVQRPRAILVSLGVRRRYRVRGPPGSGWGRLTPGRVWPQRLWARVRYRQRARRFGRGNRVRRCWAGRVRPHGVGTGLRRERLWLVDWRDGHASPSKALVGSLLLTRVQHTPGTGTGTGAGKASVTRQESPPSPPAADSPGSERGPKCQGGSIY